MPAESSGISRPSGSTIPPARSPRLRPTCERKVPPLVALVRASRRFAGRRHLGAAFLPHELRKRSELIPALRTSPTSEREWALRRSGRAD